MRSRFVAAEQAAFPVRVPCWAAGGRASGFYAWLRRGPGGRERDDGSLARRIAAIVETSRWTYGGPRVHAELRAHRRF